MQLGVRNIIIIAGSVLCFARHSFAQSYCVFEMPPMNVNTTIDEVGINHNLFYGAQVWTNGGIANICPNLFNNFSPQFSILFGGFIAPCEEFYYELIFNKPIIELTFILTGGGGGTPDGPDGGSEIHVFEPASKIANISAIWSCETTIQDNLIYLGNPLEYFGSGEFTITFTEPVCSFSISGNGCWGGSGFVICTNSIQTPPLWAAVQTPTEICGQDSVLFTAYGGVAPYTFTYSINGGAAQQVSSNSAQISVPLPTAGGSYEYELLSITDGGGTSINITCNNTSTVQVQPMPVAQFTTNPNSGFSPLNVALNNQSTNATSYVWFVNESGGFDSAQPPASIAENPLLTLNDTGVYEITLVAFNHLGCSDTTMQTVHVVDGLQVTIPNVFTPNNDDVNDWFGFTTNVEADASLVILNRWGGVVFEKSFVTNAGDFMELWDGTSTGSVATPSSVPATDGVYFYKFVVSFDAFEEEFVGFVTLKR